MSEFQYYEFQAIDRPLDATEQGELRKFSSRAAITSRRFTNEYHWGSFKGDTMEWMKRYFDAHVHLSDFGSRAVHFRLPNALVDREAVRLYQVNHVLEVASTTTHHVISFHSNEECGADPDCFDDDPYAVLGDLLPARELLATGDLRPLYLGWLLAVQNGWVDDETSEPPVPPGLGELDAVLTDLADFLWMDPALIKVAALGSGPLDTGDVPGAVREWITNLTTEDKDNWLARIIGEQDGSAPTELRRRFTHAMRSRGNPTASPRRTAGGLRAEAEELNRQQQEKAAREAAARQMERERQEREARQRHLESLRGSEARLWNSVVSLTETSVASNYDHAVKTLLDLRDLAATNGETSGFQRQLEALRELRRRKSGLLRRLDAADLV